MVNVSEILAFIPARGGSKGIPGKNIRLLNGKPLIYYTLDVAKALFPTENICVSTDDAKIAECVKAYGLDVPFLRPAELATDQATTNDAILHALNFYAQQNIYFKYTLLLQPTSPLRQVFHVEQCLEMASQIDFEMIISAKETDANPYYVLFEEDGDGYLQKTKNAAFTRRQDCPVVWQINGAIYLINNKVLLEKGDISALKKTKLVMESKYSIDLDTIDDWMFAEYMLEKGLIG
jgi:CMP-N,N'-diacetyllegionaminic acid synthase